MGELLVLGRTLDATREEAVQNLRLTWRHDNVAEVALAEKTFREWIRKGFFAVGEASGKKIQIFTFDPSLEKIILSPIVAGG